MSSANRCSKGEVTSHCSPTALVSHLTKGQWQATDVFQLHYLRDVIILSVKGPRRAADWLAGGESLLVFYDIQTKIFG